MGRYASKVVEQAKSWIGKNEADGSHQEIIDVYNAHTPLARGYSVKTTDSWCATFVSAVAIKLGYTDIIPTECSCQKMIELFKKIGCWTESDAYIAKAGDIIFYDWSDNASDFATTDNKSWADHVGIVECLDGTKMTVIEGNYNNEVKRRKLEANGRYIRGYATPKYDAEVVDTTTAGTPSTYTGNSIVDYLKSIGHKYDFASRKKLAASYGINDYIGTASQNLKLLALLRGEGTTKTESEYYAKYTGTSGRVDEVLKAIGVPTEYYGSWTKRKAIASANGISNYAGTASQNLKLIDLAKKGKLKRV